MSNKTGTPSKEPWTLNQCAQIQSAFVKALPDALGGIPFHPKDVLEAFRDNDDILEQEVFLLLNKFIGNNFPILFNVLCDIRSISELIGDLKSYGLRVHEERLTPLFRVDYNESYSEEMKYKVVGISGREFKDDSRTVENIFKEAASRQYLNPPGRLALFLREKYSQKKLGCDRVIVFNSPIFYEYIPYLFELKSSNDMDEIDSLAITSVTKFEKNTLFLFLAPKKIK